MSPDVPKPTLLLKVKNLVKTQYLFSYELCLSRAIWFVWEGCSKVVLTFIVLVLRLEAPRKG